MALQELVDRIPTRGLQNLVDRIPTTDRALQSFGLTRTNATSISPQMVGVFALGMLVGASIALLLTPVSGRELRARVQEQVNGHEEHQTN
jgi:hypothetical protein